ncbi:hypothetical protein [Nodularia chucula]|uniref:hypothetical protein n=1 Tax=Nodularia chucula TaxID=3093667 RepID=UPI0039C70282
MKFIWQPERLSSTDSYLETDLNASPPGKTSAVPLEDMAIRARFDCIIGDFLFIFTVNTTEIK